MRYEDAKGQIVVEVPDPIYLNEEEVKFWKDVVLSVLCGGNPLGNAVVQADGAVNALRERLECE